MSVLALYIFVIKTYATSKEDQKHWYKTGSARVSLWSGSLGVPTILACVLADIPAGVNDAREVCTVDERGDINLGALKRGKVTILAYYYCLAGL